MLVIAGKRRAAGRPRIDPAVEKIIIDIKADNPSYGSKRISLMVTEQLGVEVSQTTVRNVLKRQQRQPSKPKAPEGGQRWKTFLENHRATHNPSSDWVAQQIRDAYPFDDAPKRMMMDHDSIFLPLVHNTLPNMGIKVVRTSVGCPWQNGVVERFNRTLTEELLKQYLTFYNTARPHRTLDGQSPIRQENAANDAAFMPGTLRAEAIPWLGGLHHSYRRAA